MQTEFYSNGILNYYPAFLAFKATIEKKLSANT